MKKLNLQNNELEQIGRGIFKATRPSVEEIEKIVTAPQLLDSIKARIKADEQTLRPENLFLAKQSKRPLWNWQTVTGTLLILIVCSALIIYKNISGPDIQTSASLSVKAGKVENRGTKTPAVQNRINSKQIVFKPKILKQPDQARKPKIFKPSKSIPKSSPEIFYSLAAGGNLENSGEDLRVVRTELSRAELFALGINLPLENETIKIKTDLLIGEDGVARAIRFVGKF
jgi:hypothetical protein